MSTDVVKSELTQFIQTQDSSVLALKGAWGTGKTHCWNQILRDNKSNTYFKKYSYVSLFGVNTLEDLKRQIFQNSIPLNQIDDKYSVSSIEKLKGTIRTIGRKSTDIGGKITSILGKRFAGIETAALAPFVDNFLFNSVKETLICIDDLERKGDQLKIKDVLGLVSQLKEQQKCNLILLLNHNETGLEDYTKYCEKVVDRELVYEPMPHENAEIAFQNSKSCLIEYLKIAVSKLNITNIRILRLIEKSALKLEQSIRHCNQTTLQEIAHSLALFVFVNYMKQDDLPTFDSIKEYNKFIPILDKDYVLSDSERFLRDYGWNTTEEIDLALMKYVENGYLDSEFEQVLNTTDRQYQLGTKEYEYRQAWDSVLNSFDDGQETINKLIALFSKNIDVLNPTQLNNAVELMKQLGDDDRADSMINQYIEHNKSNPFAFDLSRFHLRHHWDPVITERFKEIHSSIIPVRSLDSVLSELADQHGWWNEHADVLTQTTTDDLVNYFRNLEKDKFIAHIQASLRFREINGPAFAFGKRAEDALLVLANESALNKYRVSWFGVSQNTVQTAESSE